MPAALHVPPAQDLIAARGSGAEKFVAVLVVASGLFRPAVSVAGHSARISFRYCVPLSVSRLFSTGCPSRAQWVPSALCVPKARKASSTDQAPGPPSSVSAHALVTTPGDAPRPSPTWRPPRSTFKSRLASFDLRPTVTAWTPGVSPISLIARPRLRSFRAWQRFFSSTSRGDFRASIFSSMMRTISDGLKCRVDSIVPASSECRRRQGCTIGPHAMTVSER